MGCVSYTSHKSPSVVSTEADITPRLCSVVAVIEPRETYQPLELTHASRIIESDEFHNAWFDDGGKKFVRAAISNPYLTTLAESIRTDFFSCNLRYIDPITWATSSDAPFTRALYSEPRLV